MGTLSVLLLIVFKQLELKYLFFWFFIGLLISGIFLKKVNQLYFNANKAKDIFRQYYQLLLLIESAKFESEFNKENQLKIQSANEKASLIFKRFSSALDALDQRNNMLFGVLANGFALWDLKQSANVEKQMNRYKNNMKHWFDVVSYFDAQNSFANFCFNHPNYVFPKLSSEHLISAEDLGHPLLKEAKRKDNPFSIDKQQFFIITGANMAGKSTFLRTVSLAIIMANCGLPVCAKEFNYQPIKLISSMRTSDSLAEEESYFFSELKRLKQIVSAIEKDTYFIILDEILKGTNSKDKAEGSQQFVQKLVASNSTGIIATHDLSLCALEKNHKEIENYYFDAQIIADELHFDYALKKGICQNMNASFLLRKMGIV
jgi:DNA mismatch repair ATPase MutS